MLEYSCRRVPPSVRRMAISRALKTGLGYRQVDIVDDGENEDQQSDDRQNQDELLIASVLKMETV